MDEAYVEALAGVVPADLLSLPTRLLELLGDVALRPSLFDELVSGGPRTASLSLALEVEADHNAGEGSDEPATSSGRNEATL